jgi:hypothetical protein
VRGVGAFCDVANWGKAKFLKEESSDEMMRESKNKFKKI